MGFSKDHNCLYFDKIRRVQKAEAVMSLIHATYQAKLNGGNKSEIARMLKSAYELYRFSAGSYTGEEIQFSKQYTIGHELGIWKNSQLDLNDLAIKVATNIITIKDYFDIVFLNYIQPINSKIVHPLYDILIYLKESNKSELSKTDITRLFEWVSEPENNDINGMYNMLLATNYFSLKDNNNLHLEYPISILINCCNLECVNLSLEEVNRKFSDLENYVTYLTEDHRSVDLMKYKYQLELPEDMCENESSEQRLGHELINNDLVGFNKIYYGIPGCGKSYKVSSILSYKDGFKEEANIHGINSPVESDYIFRTTFYLDYSNSDFVGQIYPVVEYKEDGSEFVTYKPLPGPFTKALLKAYTNPNKMVYLIIEEINRGNAAAIFGDLFQLLDRVKETQYGKVKGESEYPISNEFIEGYLKLVKNGTVQADGDISLLDKYINHNIIIPNNLTIFATMNTSDQNVFPLDTAFKRRWNLEKVTVDWSKNTSGEYNLDILNKCIPFTDMTWGCFINTINETMVEDEFISEDKNIGPYFIGEDILVNKEDRYNSENKYRLTKFMNNVIDYLYNDVTKLNHDILFKPGLKYSTLYNYFTEELHEDRTKQYKVLFNNILNDDIQNDDVNNIEENEDGDTE